MGHSVSRLSRWNGTAWEAVSATGSNPGPTEFRRWNGTAWVPVAEMHRWDGTAWVETFVFSE